MKDSIVSIQSHMRDKGHCLLNFDREPELLDFWENPRSGNGAGTPVLE
jgi:pre-60S factor REI1